MAKADFFKIILDVNWLISSSISAASRKKFELILLDQRFVFVVCTQLLDEYDDVIDRPVFRGKLIVEDINEFKRTFLESAELIKIGQIKRVVRDVKDDYLIALSQKSKAHFLITGDKDLLVLEKSGQTQIITMTDFLTKFF